MLGFSFSYRFPVGTLGVNGFNAIRKQFAKGNFDTAKYTQLVEWKLNRDLKVLRELESLLAEGKEVWSSFIHARLPYSDGPYFKLKIQDFPCLYENYEICRKMFSTGISDVVSRSSNLSEFDKNFDRLVYEEIASAVDRNIANHGLRV